MLQQGKRVRARLMVLFGRLLKAPENSVCLLASVIELLHAASLLHDDVLDEADHRRGDPCAHILWDNTTAILMGDMLYVRALALANRLERPDISSLLIDALAQGLQGELRQHEALYHPKMDRSVYERTIKEKTGALFAAGLKVVAKLAQPDQLWVGSWGETFGMLYQIIDDLLDISPHIASDKPLYQDFKQGVITLPTLLLYPMLAPLDQLTLESMLGTDDALHTERYAAWLEEFEIKEKIQKNIQELSDQLSEVLCEAFPPSETRSEILNMIQLLTQHFQAN